MGGIQPKQKRRDYGRVLCLDLLLFYLEELRVPKLFCKDIFSCEVKVKLSNKKIRQIVRHAVDVGDVSKNDAACVYRISVRRV